MWNRLGALSLLALGALALAPTGARAQPRVASGHALSRPSPAPYPETEVEKPKPIPTAPAGDRALLYLAAFGSAAALGIGLGATSGGLSSVLEIHYGGSGGFAHLAAGFTATPLFVASLVPVMTYLFGQLVGSGADARTFLYTSLGAILGAVGLAPFVIGAVMADDDAWVAASLVTAGCGWVVGSFVGNATASGYDAGRVEVSLTGMRVTF